MVVAPAVITVLWVALIVDGYWPEVLIIIGVVAVVLGIVIGVMFLIDCWDTSARSPGLVRSYLRAKKEKWCPHIKWED